MGVSEATHLRVSMGEIRMQDENALWSGKMEDGVTVHTADRLGEWFPDLTVSLPIWTVPSLERISL
jgi:hypothetical protein